MKSSKQQNVNYKKFRDDFDLNFLKYFQLHEPNQLLKDTLKEVSSNLETHPTGAGYFKINRLGAPLQEKDLYPHKIHLSVDIIDDQSYQKAITAMLLAVHSIPLITNAKIFDSIKILNLQGQQSKSYEQELDVDPCKALTLYFPSLEHVKKLNTELTDIQYRQQQVDAIVALNLICKELQLKPLMKGDEPIKPKGEYAAPTFGVPSDIIWVTPAALTEQGKMIMAQRRIFDESANPYLSWKKATPQQKVGKSTKEIGLFAKKKIDEEQKHEPEPTWVSAYHRRTIK